MGDDDIKVGAAKGDENNVVDVGENENEGHDIESGANKKFLPVLIIPGFMSSGLEATKSGVSSEWEGKRVWLNLEKLGLKSLHGAGALKTGDSPPPTERRFSETLRQEYERGLDCKSEWLQHLSLSHDLTSERDGMQVRPIEGLHGVDYLGQHEKQFLLQHLINAATYVFGPVIDVLKKVGYTHTNLDAAPYDWRLPPKVLQERDQYFSKTMAKVERLYHDNNDTPVVLLCHSMGCRIAHYFLNFALQSPQGGQQWLDKYIHTYMPVGAPHLGAPKALRAIVNGDKMGLDAFLSDEEGLILGRSLGSTLFLLPHELPLRNAPANAIMRDEGVIVIELSPIDCKELLTNYLITDESIPKIQLKIKYGENTLHTDFQQPTGENLTVHFKQKFLFPSHPNLPVITSSDKKLSDVFQITLRQPGIENAARKARRSMHSCPCHSIIIRIIDCALVLLKLALCGAYYFLREILFKDPTARQPLPSAQDIKDTAEDTGAKVSTTTLASSTYYHLANFLNGNTKTNFSVVVQKTGTKAYFRQQAVSIQCHLKFANPVERGKHLESIYGPIAKPLNPGRHMARHGLKDTTDGCYVKNKKHKHIQYSLAAGGNALLFGEGMQYIFDVMKENYDSDPLGPRSHSSKDAPPAKRVKAIYGVNIPTEVGAVYKRASLFLEDGKLQRLHKLDTSAVLKRHMMEYKIQGGIAMETSKTPQVILGPSLSEDHIVHHEDAIITKAKKTHLRFFKLCVNTESTIHESVSEGDLVLRCGDGTVPYWSLQHCRTWQGPCDVTVDEIEGADHREILANSTFHKVIVEYVTQGTAHLPDKPPTPSNDDDDDDKK